MRGAIRLIPCKIDRGGFSSERTFEIQLADHRQLVGNADMQHLLDSNKRPLGPDSPPMGKTINGFVKCKILRPEDSGVLVEVPSADVVGVPAADLVEST